MTCFKAHSLTLACAFWLPLGLSLARAETGPTAPHDGVDFTRDVLPILADHCFHCHGPDEASRAADLRLDRREAAVSADAGSAVIVPGHPESSPLIERIMADDDDLVMPPPAALKPLSAAQRATLRRWIAAGAEYARHWAFLPPTAVRPPDVGRVDWPRNAVDRFVLRKLEAAGLSPSPPAERHTWLRRVTLDLTGLPPTVAELNAFMSDNSRAAENNVVDRLLSSTAHAERMAMQWLDAARYADTNGYNNDEVRTMWPWRDWVIEAFHTGMPYDQFLTEQIAGDLLPQATLRQRVATGFNRNHVLTTEGGIIPAEYQAEYVADRVHTTATVFLGISLQCARCHDHKFDPLTQHDFYRFAAFFNNIPDKLVKYNSARMADPVVKVPSAEQQREIDELNARMARLEADIESRGGQVDALIAAWEAQLTTASPRALHGLGLAAHFAFDEDSGDRVLNAADENQAGRVHGPATRRAGVRGQALEFTGQTWVDAGQVGNFESDRPFSVAASIHPATSSSGTVLSKMDEANAYRGYDLNHLNGKLECHLVHRWPTEAFKVVTKEPVAPQAWHHVVVTYDGSRQASGLKIYLNGTLQAVDVTNDNRLSGSLSTDKPLHIGKRTTSLPFHGLIDDVRLYGLQLSADDAMQLAKGESPDRLAAILAVPSKDRTVSQQEQLRHFYLANVDRKIPELRRRQGEIRHRLEELERAIPVTMVMEEMATRRPTHLLLRGAYDKPGEEVQPGLPEALAGTAAPAEPTRLDLARWMTSPDNPLTARVAVNRWWEMLFGSGLVETVEDFGVQGARPSHPALLDWLARELIRRDWDQRAILKLIVLSATYRQAADVTPGLLDIDPQNRLLSRGPRWRLPAEMVRDNALAISGLLHRQVGGPSVRPYQPAGLWEDVSVERRDTYAADNGAGLYRRSMYTFWKRTCPPPGMATFDAPDRETCVVRRARTNTPLQALVLLNDPTYVEAARVFAQRIIKHDAGDPARLTFAFRAAVARPPSQAERVVVGQFLQTARRHFHSHRAEAAKLLRVGASPCDPTIEPLELAAWSSVASMLLNLDETISKP